MTPEAAFLLHSRLALGTGAGLSSQGALQMSANGRFLIAVDAASNQVSVLRVKPSGALRLVPGGVVSSGGALPVSVAVAGGLVYVANAGAGGSNYTGFRLGSGGRLTPIATDPWRCPTKPSRATCCSTALAASSSARASGPPRSTASPSVPGDA